MPDETAPTTPDPKPYMERAEKLIAAEAAKVCPGCDRGARRVGGQHIAKDFERVNSPPWQCKAASLHAITETIAVELASIAAEEREKARPLRDALIDTGAVLDGLIVDGDIRWTTMSTKEQIVSRSKKNAAALQAFPFIPPKKD